MSRFDIASATIVVTGAANGLGAALAVELARAGAGLALVDIDADGLERCAGVTGRFGRRVSTHVVDLTDPAAFPGLVDALLSAHPGIDGLINNAGTGVFGSVEDLDIAEMESLVALNFWSGVRLTKALLPHLKARPAAQIVFVASVLGLIALPFQAPYVASKFAVRGFAEALRQELEATAVGVSLVLPGGMATGIETRARVAARADPAAARAHIARYSRNLSLTPEAAAAAIVAGLRRRRPRILVGGDSKRADILQRLLPGAYPSILARAARRLAESAGQSQQSG